MRSIEFPAPPDAIAQVVWPVFTAQSAAADAPLPLPAFGRAVFLAVVLDRGTVSWQFDGAERALPLDGALLLPSDAAVRLQAAGDSRISCIGLAGALAGQLLEETRAMGGLYLPQSGAAVRAAITALGQPAGPYAPDPLTASATAYQLLMQLYRRADRAAAPDYPPLVREAMAILQQDYAYLYGIEELADRLMVTKSHLIRVFSRAVGIPPGQYLTRVRIEAAKQLLRSQDATLELVAAATGFSSAGYFGKVFRRETGVTPARYAAAAHRGEPLPDTFYL